MAAGRSDSTQARTALEKLCRTCWPPNYAFVRRQGHTPHDAQDLTQEFFARLLARKSLAWARSIRPAAESRPQPPACVSASGRYARNREHLDARHFAGDDFVRERNTAPLRFRDDALVGCAFGAREGLAAQS